MSRSSRRLSTRELVEKELGCALVKRLFEISNPGGCTVLGIVLGASLGYTLGRSRVRVLG